jgi:hypothetical protein
MVAQETLIGNPRMANPKIFLDQFIRLSLEVNKKIVSFGMCKAVTHSIKPGFIPTHL